MAEQGVEGWEVDNIPPNQEYEIAVRQEGGGVITVVGRLLIGYQRFVNPDPEGEDLYRPCAIVEGIQKDTRRQVVQYFPLSVLKGKVEFNSGPIAKRVQRSPKKRRPQ